ncbi:MAG: YceI family protein [Geminicoccaceae bacterium]
MDLPRLPVLALVMLGFVLATASARAASWTLEDGSAIRFEAYQQGAPVHGGFERFSADIVLDPDDLAGSRIEIEIEVASISTGHRDRDTALRSPGLFGVERWPTARFASAKVEHLGGEAYQALGQLTIRDVQRDVVLPFTLRIADHPSEPGLQQADATGELTISRLDYGVGQGEWASTAAVGESVVITIQIVAAAKR